MLKYGKSFGAHHAIGQWPAASLFWAFICAIPSLSSGAIASAPVLSGANYSAGQFQFQLSGESNAAYIVESSTNMQSWRHVLTNTVSSATRSIVVNALDEGTYYRAFIATPIFAFALAAETVVDLNGNNLKTDSFDSADPVKSFFGNYDPSKAQAGGNIGAYRGLILEMRASGGA